MVTMRRFLPVFAILLSLFAVFPNALRAEERVLNFDVTAKLQSDGSMIVTERITVNIEHDSIKHGLTRGYLAKTTLAGTTTRYEFEALSVTLDGQPIPYRVSGSDPQYHVLRIGGEDTLAPLGEHVYEIVHKTRGLLSFRADYDSISYNALGSGWKVPIDRASFTLDLPEGSENAYIKTVANTSAPGERGSDYTLDGKRTVRTTRTLAPGERLTVVYALQKGLLSEPAVRLADAGERVPSSYTTKPNEPAETKPAKGGERVLSFDVTAKLQSDGAMIVTERIRVNIEHTIIRRGITYAYPLKEIYDGRKMRHYGFELLSVKLDGEPVRYHTSEAALHYGMAIGNANKLAPLGDHTYELVYKTTGHVRPMQDRDEIYYNVMSSDWEFPVDRVSFTLELPGGGEDAFLDTVAYTGGRGATGSDYVLEGKGTVRTTRTLQKGEGITVAMAWKKGLVTLPGASLADFVGGNRTLVLIGIFIIILLYFLLARFIYSYAPKGVIVPLFSAPQGMSPGYMAVLKHMALTGRMLHADIVWAAVNGFLRLDARDKKKVLLRKVDLSWDPTWEKPKPKISGSAWAQERCQDLTDSLFPSSLTDEVDLRSPAGQRCVGAAFSHLESEYGDQEDDLWKRSYLPAIPGAILCVVLYCWVTQYIYSPALFEYDSVFEYLAITGFLFGLTGMFIYAMRRAARMFDGLRRAAGLFLGSLTVLAILAGLWAIAENDYFFMGMYAATVTVTVRGIATPPGRRTPEGREKYRQVQGLEMYIRTAETHRLAQLNAPEDTVEKFEELLPYAVALGCADAWQKRFDKVLLAEEYVPEWVDSNYTEKDMYRSAFAAVAAGGSGIAAAASAARAASAAARFSARWGSDSGSSGSSGGSRSSGGSGFGGGSSGGGSGGSRVGGW